MTQKEIAEKYGVPQCDVSIAIKYYFNDCGIVPLGKRKVIAMDGREIYVNEYDDQKVALAVSHLYIVRSEKHLVKARAWTDNAQRIYDIANAK